MSQRKCSSCGSNGHTRRSRQCPNHSSNEEVHQNFTTESQVQNDFVEVNDEIRRFRQIMAALRGLERKMERLEAHLISPDMTRVQTLWNTYLTQNTKERGETTQRIRRECTDAEKKWWQKKLDHLHNENKKL